ncbi:MAG: thiamine pyrophosphate-dependent enzyme [Caldilineaceae bacterium]
MFVGSSAIEAAPCVQQLAETLQAPVVSSRSGSILDSRHYLAVRTTAGHRLWKGGCGAGHRHPAAKPADHVGTDDELKIIRVRKWIKRSSTATRQPALSRTSGAQPGCAAATAACGGETQPPAPIAQEEMAALHASIDELMTAIEPQMSFIRAAGEELPEDGIYVDDLTQVGYVSRVAFRFTNRTYLSAGYQGTLGWGFAAALGAKVANPDKPVLSISGDGGFMFNMQNWPPPQHKINTVSVVFNDGAYGNVRRMQRYDHGERLIASDLKNPDFVKLAEAFDMQGLRANGPDELRCPPHCLRPQRPHPHRSAGGRDAESAQHVLVAAHSTAEELEEGKGERVTMPPFTAPLPSPFASPPFMHSVNTPNSAQSPPPGHRRRGIRSSRAVAAGAGPARAGCRAGAGCRRPAGWGFAGDAALSLRCA